MRYEERLKQAMAEDFEVQTANEAYKSETESTSSSEYNKHNK